MKTFEKTLPEGYHPVYCIDAKDRKTMWLINLMSLIPFFAIIIPMLLYYKAKTGLPIILLFDASISHYLVLIGVYIAYVFGHELVHGVVYWFFTRQKLTFGVAPFIASCGVPDIYVYRRPALAAVLAPLVVFSVVFSVAILISATMAWKIIWVLALTVHVGGCIGDIWIASLMIFKFQDSSLLVKDTGPKQTFFDI